MWPGIEWIEAQALSEEQIGELEFALRSMKTRIDGKPVVQVFFESSYGWLAFLESLKKPTLLSLSKRVSHPVMLLGIQYALLSEKQRRVLWWEENIGGPETKGRTFARFMRGDCVACGSGDCDGYDCPRRGTGDPRQDAIQIMGVAARRHEETDYDELLRRGVDRDTARDMIRGSDDGRVGSR